MKRTALIFLACIIPAALCAQQSKLLDGEIKEPSASQPADTKKAETAPAAEKQSAEIIPVIAPGPAKAEKPAVVRKAATVQKPGAVEKTAIVQKPAVVERPVFIQKPAVSKPVPAVKTSTKPVKNGARVVLPKENGSAKFIPSELVQQARITPQAIRAGGFLVGKKHKVNKGDTLWDLSGKYYKDPFLWGKIYNANFKTVANPDLIHPKEELIIPELSDLLIPYRRAPAVAAVAAVAAEEGEVLAETGWTPGSAPAAQGKAALYEPGEILKDFDQTFISEEMPEDQKEWSDGMKVVPDSWSEDGEITAKIKSDNDSMDESYSLSGEVIEVSMNRSGMVKPGDYLAVYLKGGDAYSKSGKRLGRELQPAGLAEVVSVNGSRVKTRLIDATTAIFKGYIVKKK